MNRLSVTLAGVVLAVGLAGFGAAQAQDGFGNASAEAARMGVHEFGGMAELRPKASLINESAASQPAVKNTHGLKTDVDNFGKSVKHDVDKDFSDL